MQYVAGEPARSKSNKNRVGTIVKGCCFDVQVSVHLARFLQPCQVKIVPSAEAKAVGMLVGAQDALTEGVLDEKVERLECSMIRKGMKNVTATIITSLAQPAGNTPWRALVCICQPSIQSAGERQYRNHKKKKKSSCGFGTVGFQLVLPLDSG